MTDCCKEVHVDEGQRADSAEMAAAKYAGPSEFAHLHVHTLFSPLDGVASADEYLHRAKHFGMKSIAITDHGSLGSLPDAYFASKDTGIKIIPGIEAYLNEYHVKFDEFRAAGMKIGDIAAKDPDLSDRIRRNRHLIILCKNTIGFKNLLQITNKSWEIGFYYKPRLWLDAIRPFKEGLIILSGCLNGPISYELSKAVDCKVAGDMSGARAYLGKAVEWVKKLKDEFGDDFYIEVQMPGPKLKKGYDVLKLSLDLAKKYNVKYVLTGDCHYLVREDFLVQKAMMSIDQGKTIYDEDAFGIDTDEGYLKSRAEFRQTFHEQEYAKFATINDIETACDTSLLIADKCDSWIPNLDPKLPAIEDANNKITMIVAKRLRELGLDKRTEKFFVDGKMVTYLEQSKIELDRIKEKGFSSYFLITKDLIDYSRSIGYPVGPGRGSAGGSLVSYLLGIHEMDTLAWGLSFDRFLSPSRGGNLLKVTME